MGFMILLLFCIPGLLVLSVNASACGDGVPTLILCGIHDCLDNCFHFGSPTAVANIQSWLALYPHFNFKDYPEGFSISVEGSWIAYSVENYQGTSYELSKKSYISISSFASQITSFRPIGDLHNTAASTITFFEEAGYLGKVLGPILTSQNLAIKKVYNAYVITGDSNWLIKFGKLELPGYGGVRFDLCATPGFFKDYELSRYPIDSVQKGCTPLLI